MSVHSKAARAYFEEGYSCSQAVFLAFTDVTGLDRETSLRISSSFGGGMGRLREVCGALAAAFMALGAAEGYTDPADTAAKTYHYERVQELGLSFKRRYGTLLCRELLELDVVHDLPEPEERTKEYYKKRKCGDYVEHAAELLDKCLGIGESK